MMSEPKLRPPEEKSLRAGSPELQGREKGKTSLKAGHYEEEKAPASPLRRAGRRRPLQAQERIDPKMAT